MRLLFYFSLFFICHSALAQESNYLALIIDKALTENANAIVRLDEMEIDIKSPDEMTYKVKKVVTVLNRSGNKHASTYVAYDKETKIKSIEAYVYGPLGNEIKHIKKKDFQDVSAVDGFSLYIDNRILKHRYTPTQYPYTIEFKYEIETSDTGFFPSWYFLSGYNVSIEKSYFAISYASPDLKPDIKEYNLDKIEVVTSDIPGLLTFTSENIQAIEPEILSPAFGNIVPRLSSRLNKFSLKGENATVTNWKDLGNWMNSALLKDRSELNPETIALAKSLVKGKTDDLEKAKIIYKYVQDNTRYISVQIGIGGWKPIRAIDVDRVKYGDCKGLSNYAHALLKAVGVRSYYTVIQAGRQKIDFDPDFAKMQGNHAILAIPYKEQYYWIDCTSQIKPFGFAGNFTDDRKALVVTPDGGQIIKTIAYLDEQNYQNTQAKCTLLADGSFSGDVTIKTQGIQYENRFRLDDKSKDEVTKHYKDYWDYINNLDIKSYSFKNNRDDIEFAENISVKAASYASTSGNRILFAPNAFNKNKYVPQRYRNRKLPLRIQRGFLDEDEVKIQIPDGFTFEAVPETVDIENKFGAFSMGFEELGDLVILRRKLLIKNGNYPSTDYAAYRAFMKKVAKWDNSKIVLIKS